MRTVRTCSEGLAFGWTLGLAADAPPVLLAPAPRAPVEAPAGAEPPLVALAAGADADVPPASAAAAWCASAHSSTSALSSSARAAEQNLDRLSAPVLAKTSLPSRRLLRLAWIAVRDPRGPPAAPDVIGYAPANRRMSRKLRSARAIVRALPRTDGCARCLAIAGLGGSARPAANGAGSGTGAGSTPAKAACAGFRRERAGGQAVWRVGQVVAGGRDVVGRVGVEERGEVLVLVATDAELELAAAVVADAALGAVVVGVEQVAQAAEARGLDVDHARRVGQRLDVGDRVDRRVPGEALAVGGERGVGLGGERGILDPGVREGFGDAPVEQRVGWLVDDRARVVALEVDGVDGARRDELGDEPLVPRARGVELEAQRGIALQALRERLHARRLAEAQGDDEPHGLGLSLEHGVQRGARLAQREVEGGGLVGPRAVAARDLALGRLREQLERLQALAELGERVLAGEGEHGARLLEDVVVDGVVGDVLPPALLAGAAQADDGALALELARDLRAQRLERVVVDAHPQAGERKPGAHAPASRSSRATSSSRRSSSSAPATAASWLAQSSISALPSLTRASVSLRLASPESSRRMISSTRAVAAS